MAIAVNEQLPANVQDAIREFNFRYENLRVDAQSTGWVARFGEVFTMDAPLGRFPLAQLAGKYEEFRGDNVTETLEERYVDLTVGEFQTGHEANALSLVTNTLVARLWDKAPASFLLREQRFIERGMAGLIEAGTSGLCKWDNLSFWNIAHLANPGDSSKGTFSNYQTVAKAPTIANIEVESSAMGGVLDVNGDSLGAEATHMMLPGGIFLSTKNLLGQQFVPNAAGTATMNNPFLGNIVPEKILDFKDANDWYLVDMNLIAATGLVPWAAFNYFPPGPLGTAMGLKVYGPESDYFKDHDRVKIVSKIMYGFALLFPHAVRRVTGV